MTASDRLQDLDLSLFVDSIVLVALLYEQQLLSDHKMTCLRFQNVRGYPRK